MEVAIKLGSNESVLSRHHPLGVSTGYMKELRGDWKAQIAEALAVSPFAVELSALSEEELGPLHDYLAAARDLPFRYLSIHGPSKNRQMSEKDLVNELGDFAGWSDGIVMHNDTVNDPACYRPLGGKILFENMDSRKDTGRTYEELAPVFAELPEAGFCFDIAHAWSIDPSMSVAEELLDRFGNRLRHVHVSSLSHDLQHVPLTAEDEELFRPILERCVDVPWILEAPLRAA